MLSISEDEIVEILENAKEIFKGEPNYIELESDKPMIFVGDTHGDIETTKHITKRFLGVNRLVFLGDYVDRSPSEMGSIKNIIHLLELKVKNPDLIMLRGNHEFSSIFSRYDFKEELYDAGFDETKKLFEDVFSQMPYIISTENGLIGLHGGLPNISDSEEIKNLPKGIKDYNCNTIISQIVWNDNVVDNEILEGEDFESNSDRGFYDDGGLIYGESYFSEKMKILGKNVLVRGHDYRAKGFSLNDRILTIFTSRAYTGEGMLKGTYVAVMDDPQKEIKSARDLRIEYV